VGKLVYFIGTHLAGDVDSDEGCASTRSPEANRRGSNGRWEEDSRIRLGTNNRSCF
jgi:hypothetical protein